MNNDELDSSKSSTEDNFNINITNYNSNTEVNASKNEPNNDSIDNPTDYDFESGINYSNKKQSHTKSNSKNNTILESKIEKRASLKEAFRDSELYIFFKVWLNINRWGLFIYIILVSFCIVFFVSNVRVVTKLLDDIVKLNKYKNEINSKNKILEVKLVEMQSPERINKIAIEQLGFEKATEAPFYIDKSKY